MNLTQGPGAIRHFTGSQIRTRNTEIGTHMTVDNGSTSFSVLVQAVTLASISDHQRPTTEAIVTAHTGPNSAPSPVLFDPVAEALAAPGFPASYSPGCARRVRQPWDV